MDKHSLGALMLANVARAKEHRMRARASAPSREARTRLRVWQQARLEKTHADLLASPRYHDAARFFLDDLYGPKEFARRDDDIVRIVPTLVRLLPEAALATLAQAIELDALSEDLDAALIAQLPDLNLTHESYADAYRACANRRAREHQLAITHELGESLNRLTRVPLLRTTLKLMGGPARAAGLGDLQRFLERGFAAFKKMGDATEFVQTIVTRESVMMNRWFDEVAGHDAKSS